MNLQLDDFGFRTPAPAPGFLLVALMGHAACRWFDSVPGHHFQLHEFRAFSVVTGGPSGATLPGNGLTIGLSEIGLTSSRLSDQFGTGLNAGLRSKPVRFQESGDGRVRPIYDSQESSMRCTARSAITMMGIIVCVAAEVGMMEASMT